MSPTLISPSGAGDLAGLLGFAAFLVVPLLIYLALVARGTVRVAAAKPKGAGRRLFGPLFVGYTYWLMRPLFRLALWSRITPNQVTVATLGVAAVTALAIGSGHFALAAVLLMAGGSLDILDGQLARLRNMATLQGAFLDSTVDRICDGLVFGGCVFYYAGTPMIFVSLAVLIMSFTVSYARGRAEALGVSGAEGLMQRADRLTVLAIALAVSPYFAHRSEGRIPHPFYAITAVSLCLLAVLSTVTAVSRILWTLEQLKLKSTPSVVSPVRRDRDDRRPVDLGGVEPSLRLPHEPKPALGLNR
jgi:CDP-diacylglycerol--glycerol-3-phosphate 3-phosphatidyltransferase